MTDKEAYEAWFRGEQGKPYDGAYTFAKAAWHAAIDWLRSQGDQIGEMAQDENGEWSLRWSQSVPYGAKLFIAPQPAIPGGWQPIETAPTDGALIIVANDGGTWLAKYKSVYPSGYRPDNPWQCMLLNHDHIGKRLNNLRPTHWMPLPQHVGPSK